MLPRMVKRESRLSRRDPLVMNMCDFGRSDREGVCFIPPALVQEIVDQGEIHDRQV